MIAFNGQITLYVWLFLGLEFPNPIGNALMLIYIFMSELYSTN